MLDNKILRFVIVIVNICSCLIPGGVCSDILFVEHKKTNQNQCFRYMTDGGDGESIA